MYFSQFCRLGSPISRCQHCCVLVKALFLVHNWCLLTVSSHGGSGKGSLWVLFYFYFFVVVFKIFLNWSLVNLQCCASFRCTAKLFSYTYIHIIFSDFSLIGYYKILNRASLVAQWLRICLPMQGTRVRALVWEDPTCHGATRPMSHNYWACTFGACAPQQERPRQWEVRALQWRVAPARRN